MPDILRQPSAGSCRPFGANCPDVGTSSSRSSAGDFRFRTCDARPEVGLFPALFREVPEIGRNRRRRECNRQVMICCHDESATSLVYLPMHRCWRITLRHLPRRS
ncbi:hypothetical protein C8034_v007737 [Colletotrichum sidae]|uniref:Uncharacterized protein n=1 Tax=Colletotrichum sidae TaxID=1347389 RepID=A0A4R8TT96_9PEZI|nr:hypothetical protein C8034_v007737 [Colletotrichum sidae]